VYKELVPFPMASRSVVAGLLGLRVRIPPGTWLFVSCECCVLSGGGFCEGPITRPEGVLPSLVCLSVIVNPRQWEGPGPLGAVAP
jgi:hypothetical protein